MFRRQNMQSKKQMSLQKIPQPQPPNYQCDVLKQVVHSVQTKKYHFIVQTPPDIAKPNVYWSLDLPLSANTRKRHLVFKNIQYIISNWTGDDFSSILYLGVDGMSGYYSKEGILTNKIAALQLTVINPVMDQSNVRTYQLKYTLRQSVTWQIPDPLIKIQLQVYDQDKTSPITGKLPNPLTLNFEYRTQ